MQTQTIETGIALGTITPGQMIRVQGSHGSRFRTVAMIEQASVDSMRVRYAGMKRTRLLLAGIDQVDRRI